MVDISSQEKKINIKIQSGGVQANVGVTQDTAQFYSEKAREWAISNRIVDGVDYSSKYYANKSNQSALNAQSFAQSAQDSYNNFQQSVDSALNNIDSSVQGGIEEINNTKTDIITDIEFVADGEKKEIEELIDSGKDELKEAIGDVKVLTTLKIGQIGIAPLGIDETLNMERYLNGQIIIQDQFEGFTSFLKKRVALYPSIACLEDEWQTIVANSDFSQCGKFVIDNNAGTIRLPKVVNIQGLTDLSKLGEIVEAGLPNIEGSATGKFYGGGLATGDNETGCIQGGNTASFNYGNLTSTDSFYAGFNIDASLSNPIYNNSTTVQQEQIQYPYFIQVATGSEIEDNIINEIELNNPFSLLDYKYSEYELNNLSWLRSNGQYNSKAVYPAVYDLLLKIYNGVETKAGVSVKLSTEAFTDYDFVLNTAEETFRLPILTKDRVVIETKTVAYATENDSAISYTYTLYNDGWLEYNGRFSLTGPSTVILPIPFSDIDYNIQITDGGSARINYGYEIYNTSTFKIVGSAVGQVGSWYACGYTTKPQNTNLYFYVGETVQNANLINAGRIEEKLSNYTTHNMVDGQWIRKYKKLSTATTIGNYTLDLSDYLPNDGYAYEINMNIYVSRSDSSGTNTGAFIYNASLGMTGSTGDSEDYFAMVVADGSHMAQSVSSGIAIVTQNRKLNVSIAKYSPKLCYVSAVAYRRIGTNV